MNQMVACPSCSGEGCEPHAIAWDPIGRCDGSGEVTEARRREITEWHQSEIYKQKFYGYDQDENDWDPMDCD